MLNITMDDETRMSYNALYETSRPEFKEWLNLNMNLWYLECKKRIIQKHIFHTTIADFDEDAGINADSKTLFELMGDTENVWKYDDSLVIFPSSEHQDQIIKELEEDEEATTTNGDATLIIVNHSGIYCLVRIPIDFDKVINAGEPYQRNKTEE